MNRQLCCMTVYVLVYARKSTFNYFPSKGGLKNCSSECGNFVEIF